MQHGESKDVHYEPRGGDDQHRLPQDLGRRHETSHGLEQNPADDQQQAQAIDEGGENLEALVAECSSAVGRSFADVKRNRRKRERHRIREHVPGVGEQRKRASENTADDLHHHEGARQNQRDDDAPHVAVTVAHVAGGSIPGDAVRGTLAGVVPECSRALLKIQPQRRRHEYEVRRPAKKKAVPFETAFATYVLYVVPGPLNPRQAVPEGVLHVLSIAGAVLVLLKHDALMARRSQ